MSKTIAPATHETAFNCPHCGALTTQTWHRLYSERITDGNRIPFLPSLAEHEELLLDGDLDEDDRRDFKKFLSQLDSAAPFLTGKQRSVYTDHGAGNVHLSECFNCRGLAIWVHDRLIYPEIAPSIMPNADLGDEVKADFIEARSILGTSPRGAAALLRLAVQKLCIQLGESGKNIDSDIASLVKKGLSPKIQRALDIVRVVGNESVHPGELDVRDDVETATKLLTLVNLVAEQMISHPREIDSLYEKLPASKREAIERRDLVKPAK
ncbi:DUF4145 domain-containing protein [Burkholderia ambifaria]|jgi:hypothetical protein|uniref:DUF4145 domain-containing protein n=1 Tax=Burkholderia ambifaria TaxID=152480 RepID=UPI00158B5D08|nr:DUF4145 domain-containing protein [Burkholderia ambifaria]